MQMTGARLLGTFSTTSFDPMSKSKNQHTSLDSQCYTYLIDAMAGLVEPTDDLAEQRVALFRTLLYRNGGLFISPTLRMEYQRIRDQARAAFHEDMTTLFPEIQELIPSLIAPRIAEFLKLHDDHDDCKILAEAEVSGMSTLLSFDSDFISSLSGASSVAIRRPAEYWQSLDIPKGAKTVIEPSASNPMSAQTWWRWI